MRNRELKLLQNVKTVEAEKLPDESQAEQETDADDFQRVKSFAN